MQNFSKRALMEFIETSIKKGWINLNTGGGVRAACRQILEHLGDEDDVRGVDVGSAVAQFANRNPGKLAGPSLRVYESRVKGMIDNFTSFVSDPVSYKPATKVGTGRSRKTEGRNGKDVSGPKAPAEPVAAPVHHAVSHSVTPRASATETSLTLPFPLRVDFLAQVTVPRDMTRDEAKRLAVFIDALAQDKPAVTG
jgi:hypothetical protein